MRFFHTLLSVCFFSASAVGCAASASDDALDDTAETDEGTSDDVEADELTTKLGATKVLSYNIRRNDNQDKKASTERGQDVGDYRWSTRRKHVLEAITDSKAQLIGLQEAQENMPAEVISVLPGFEVFPSPQSGVPTPVYYSTNRFVKTNGGTFTAEGKGECAAKKHGAWVQLTEKGSGQKLLFVNVHLKAKDDCGAEREKGARQLKEIIAQFGAKRHIVVTGDFNVDLNDPRNNVKTGKLETTFNILRKTGRNLQVANDTKQATDASSATFNAHWKSQAPSPQYLRFDYVFFSSKLNASAYKVDRREVNFNGKDADSPSDHFPVTATIKE
jgi:endonuclease/exonuclease/phosphatase family metal-dependent hydrolase